MAKLTKRDVEHLAHLAKLKLKDKEIELLLPQLVKIIEYVGELSNIDTSGIEPTSQTTGLENIFRADEVKIEQALTHEGHFSVDAVIKKND